MWVIRASFDDQLFWSNEQGWVESPDEDRFTAEERQTLNLPMEGVWAFVIE